MLADHYLSGCSMVARKAWTILTGDRGQRTGPDSGEVLCILDRPADLSRLLGNLSRLSLIDWQTIPPTPVAARSSFRINCWTTGAGITASVQGKPVFRLACCV